MIAPVSSVACQRVTVLADAHDEWRVTDRRYLSEASMALLYKTRDTEPAAEITRRP